MSREALQALKAKAARPERTRFTAKQMNALFAHLEYTEEYCAKSKTCLGQLVLNGTISQGDERELLGRIPRSER